MDTININNTSYSIEEKWLEVAKKYFNNENISLHKAGAFGYMNEIMAQEIKSNVYHRNFIFDEYFLNTASTSKSIYNFAKQRNYNITYAKPAHLSVNLSISKDDIINSSKFIKIENTTKMADSDSLYEFILNNSIQFLVNKYNFKLPYNVQILFNYNNVNKDYSVTARYMIDDTNYFEDTIMDPYIKTWEDTINGKNYVFLKLEVYQIEKRTFENVVYNEDLGSSLFYRYEFEKQMAFFEVHYEYENETTKLQTIFNNTFVPSSGQKYCFFNLLTPNVLEISFSPLFNSFRPQYGSKLTVNIYYTDGSSGNFEYDGTISINYDNELNADDLSRIIMLVTPITDCVGGEDQPNLLQIKKDLIEDNLVRNNIITDSDLDYFFNGVNTNAKINGSNLKFVKKRNDVLKRLHSAFLLMKDNNKMIVPTRTINNVYISMEQLRSMGNSISEKSVVIYDINNKNYFISNNSLEIETYNKNSNFLLYSIPYLINVETNNIPKCNYYKTSIDREISVNSKYINPAIPYKFIINSINIYRTSIKEDVYTIRLECSTTINLNEDIDSILKIRGIFKTLSGEPYGYFEFNRVDENNLTYEAKIAVDTVNSFNNDRINIYNSLYNIKTSAILDNEGYTSIRNCYLPENVNMEIQILYKSNYSDYKYQEAAMMPDLDTVDASDDKTFATLTVVNNKNSINLFNEMSGIMESLISIESSGIRIKSVPVVEYNFFKNNNSYIFDTLSNYISIIQDNIELLENNTNIDLKFYNSHGQALYHCNNIKQDKDTGVFTYDMTDRIDLTLDMDICVNRTVSEELDNTIKQYISDFIESCNTEGIFPISNLQRRLEMEFDIIKYSELNSINGIDTKKIISKYKSIGDITNKKELDEYVPEYMNLRKEISTVKKTDNVETKVYRYAITINYI